MSLRRLSCGALITFALSACGGKVEAPTTPEDELAHIAWELVKPLGSSRECKQIGDALEPWLASRAARFQELVGQVKKLSGANADNFDTVEVKLKGVMSLCGNPNAVRTKFTEYDERVARVFGMLPKTLMGLEMR